MTTTAKKLRWPLKLAATLAVLGIIFFGVLPPLFDTSVNKVESHFSVPVSPEAQRLHDGLTIVDLHADSLLWDRDIAKRSSRGQVDLPRLQSGNVALQTFSSVTKVPFGQNYQSNGSGSDMITLLVIAQLQPIRTWGSLLQRSLYHAEKLDHAVAESQGGLLPIRAPRDLDLLMGQRARGKRETGALLSVEGLHDLEGDIANLDRLYDAGFRMAGLTHFFDNKLAGSMHGEKKGGLTPFGRAVVRRMEAKGMIVDVAHLSHAGVADVIAMARRPIVSSHGGVQAVCKENRNLTDAEIRGVASTGGLIGIGYWEGAVCALDPRAIAASMKHVRDLVGISHLALGSDFDGDVTTPFDTSSLAQLTQALIEAGFSESDIRAAMGGNALRVIGAGLRPMDARPMGAEPTRAETGA